MFSSVFLFIMLQAFKHTHLISDLDVFPCIPLHLLSSCTFRAFFDKPPCPTSLNIVLYPSHWQTPLTVPRHRTVSIAHYHPAVATLCVLKILSRPAMNETWEKMSPWSTLRLTYVQQSYPLEAPWRNPAWVSDR